MGIKIGNNTDDQGRVSFDLSDGEYKFRADYLGYQFWSGEFIWADTTVTIENGIAQIHVHRSGSPIIGARVYLFKGSGGYLGRYTDTDDGGNVEFELPVGSAQGKPFGWAQGKPIDFAQNKPFGWAQGKPSEIPKAEEGKPGAYLFPSHRASPISQSRK